MGKSLARVIGITILVLLMDLGSKYLIENVNPVLVTKNSGFIFGLGQIPASYLVILCFLVLILVLAYLLFKNLNLEKIDNWLGTGLLLGGAVANLVDRLFDYQIVDFISIWILPKFNLADLCIVAGVILIFMGFRRTEKVSPDAKERISY